MSRYIDVPANGNIEIDMDDIETYELIEELERRM